MKRFFKWSLIVFATLFLIVAIFIGQTIKQSLPIHRELEEIIKRNPAELNNYLNTKVNKDNVHIVMRWFDVKYIRTTPNYIIHLIYSNLLRGEALQAKNNGDHSNYIKRMTKASTVYVFADAVMTGDYMRCKDKTSRAGISALRSIYFPPINEFLTNEADNPTRETILKEGFMREERIASRPTNQQACAHGMSNFTGKNQGYISMDEWVSLRASTIEDLKKAYTSKYLPKQPATLPAN